MIELPFRSPSAEAYWAAGQRVVGLADVLLAVWDGTARPAAWAATADVVAFARERGVPTTVLWPAGSRRGPGARHVGPARPHDDGALRARSHTRTRPLRT